MLVAIVLIAGAMAQTPVSQALTDAKVHGSTKSVASLRPIRTNIVARLKLVQDGVPLSGMKVSWATVGDDSASGGPKLTDADGKVSFGAVTGDVAVKVWPDCGYQTICYSMDKCVAPTQTVAGPCRWGAEFDITFTGTEQVLSYPLKPQMKSLTVRVVLPNGAPVRDAEVLDCPRYGYTPYCLTTFVADGWIVRNYWDTDSSSFSPNGAYIANCMILRSGRQCSIGKSNGDGLVTFYGFSFNVQPGSGLTAYFDDGALRQVQEVLDPVVDFSASPALTITMPYMSYVDVSTDEQVVGEGDPAIITVTAKDDAGDPIPDKTLAIAGVSTASVSSVLAVDVGSRASCAPVRSARTNSSGKASLKVCPTRAGVFYVRARGLVPSRNIKVFVGPKIGKGQWRSAAFLASKAGLTVPRGATVTVKVVDRYKANCSVIKNSLYTAKAGGCRFAVTVTPKTGKRSAKYLAYRITS